MLVYEFELRRAMIKTRQCDVRYAPWQRVLIPHGDLGILVNGPIYGVISLDSRAGKF